MDPEETIAAVRDTTSTELSRLGSDKALIAATGANLTTAAVLGAATVRERGLATVLDEWADVEPGPAAGAFETAATAAERRAEGLDADPAGDDPFAAHLASVDTTPERVGAGLVAVPLIADRFYLQVVNFFVNEADESRADQCRQLRESASDLGPAREVLASLESTDRTAVRDAAVATVEAAYDDYAATLRELGLDPKPVC